MKKINIRRLYYHVSTQYFTLKNAVIVLALIISVGWIWGSLGVMQRNYGLQKELEDKKRQLLVAQLDTKNAQLAQKYYKTNEYKELAARQLLGLVKPGESVLILPPNSQEAINADSKYATKSVVLGVVSKSNFEQWMDFLFGVNNQKISG
ncbi:hypothetical protein HGB24_01300 [Candidatus Saccharibacteria bacterium]|nr:hypothetical protein [Candidatus Saccharibacteria bacterium]